MYHKPTLVFYRSNIVLKIFMKREKNGLENERKDLEHYIQYTFISMI